MAKTEIPQIAANQSIDKIIAFLIDFLAKKFGQSGKRQ